MSAPTDTMKNFFNVLKNYSNDTTINGVTVLDQAVRTTTRFAGLQDAINNFVADIARATENYGATESLKLNCGMILGAERDRTADTGAVIGYNAGNGELKDAQSIVPEDDVILSELPAPVTRASSVHSYTGADGKTFYYTVTYPYDYLEVMDLSTVQSDENGSMDYSNVPTTYIKPENTYYDPRTRAPYSGVDLATSTLNMIKGIENYWMDESLKLAYDSYGLDFNNKNINVIFATNAPYSADTTPTGLIDMETFFPVDSIDIHISADGNLGLDPSDPNGKSAVLNISYYDRTIAHEMIHAVMFGAGLFKQGMPQFFTEGIAELVQGLDDYDGYSYYRGTNKFGTPDIFTGFASNTESLREALPLKEGTGTSSAYAAGYMFLRYLTQQSLPVNTEFVSSTESNTFNHSTSQDIISGYKDIDKINLASGVQVIGTNISGNDLFVSSNIGTMILRDGYGKILNFADENGDIQSHQLFANRAGVIDFRTCNEKITVYGADNSDNDIWAGNGGSLLWGGAYGKDNLIGGDGVDEFIAGVGSGNDSIFKAENGDTINLNSTTMDQISVAQINSDGINFSFTDGSTLNVLGNVDATFKLADGSTYLADQSSSQWIKK